MTSFPTVELTVYPYECDAFGHMNQASLLALLDRARWDALARGPGMDLFERNGVWAAARKTVIEYEAGVYPRDVVRVETAVAHRGTTSMTLRLWYAGSRTTSWSPRRRSSSCASTG